MIWVYAVLGIILGFPLIILAGLFGGIGGFIHGRINRWRRRRARRRQFNWG